MADIIYRELGLGLYEVDLVSEAVVSYVADKLGDEPMRSILANTDELWQIAGAAERAGFTVAAEEELSFDYGVEFDL